MWKLDSNAAMDLEYKVGMKVKVNSLTNMHTMKKERAQMFEFNGDEVRIKKVTQTSSEWRSDGRPGSRKGVKYRCKVEWDDETYEDKVWPRDLGEIIEDVIPEP